MSEIIKLSPMWMILLGCLSFGLWYLFYKIVVAIGFDGAGKGKLIAFILVGLIIAINKFYRKFLQNYGLIVHKCKQCGYQEMVRTEATQ